MSKGDAGMSTIINKCKVATGQVICADIDKKGSGFFVSDQGDFITNNHVVTNMVIDKTGAIRVDYSKQILIKINNNIYKATLSSDEDADRPIVYDYAILKATIPSNTYIEIADVSEIAQGEQVVALGYPLDFDKLIATSGIISAVISRPSHINSLHKIKTFLTDTLVAYGSSGGPLIRVSDGNVLGITTMHHAIRDEARERLSQYIDSPEIETTPQIRDLTDFVLRYVSIGLNHALSIEYAMADSVFKSNKGRD